MKIADYNVDALLDAGRYWGLKLAQEQTTSIVEDVYDSFEAFKTTKIRPDGTVECWEFHGLLGENGPGWHSEYRPAEDVEAYRCAGPWVENDVDLAFHLLQVNDSQFMAALRKHGVPEVFSAIGIWSRHEINLDSLVRLNRLFVEMFKIELETARMHLDVVNRVGAEMFEELRKRDREQSERAANARLHREKKLTQEIEDGNDLRSRYRSHAIAYCLRELKDGRRPTFKAATNYAAHKSAKSPETVKKYLAGVLDEAQRIYAERRE